MRFFSVLLLCLALCTSALAQGVAVTGVVTDAAGDPIIGVAVTVQGNAYVGTTTDVNGAYSITAPSTQSVLNFSFIGYNETQQTVGDRRQINVTLAESSEMIAEVEVVQIGYGTARRRDLTGSVASVSSRDLAAAPVSNVAQALQGKLAGVNILSQDGRPDASINIRVRGGGSISQSNEPLVLIDGISGNMNDIAPDQVQSIDVLKDASSTAIYGARGANGVILVTTKRAQTGKATVSYSGYAKWNTPVKYYDVLSPYDYLDLKWGLSYAYGGQSDFEKVYDLTGGGIDAYKNVKAYDLQKELYNTSFSHNHDVTVSAGTDQTKVLFSLSYTDEQGMRINSYSKRAIASLKLEQKLFDNLTFNLDARYMDRKGMGGSDGMTNGRGGIFSDAYRFRPIAMEDMRGDATGINLPAFSAFDMPNQFDVQNPVNRTKATDSRTFNNNIRGTGSLTWNVIKGLTARSELTLSRSNGQTKNWTGAVAAGDSYYASSGLQQTPDVIHYAGNADWRRNDRWSLRWSNTLNYDINIGEKHQLGVLVGQEVTDNGGSDMRIQGSRFPANFTKDNAFAMITQYENIDGKHANQVISTGVETPGRILSYFGRVNYSFNDRYLFTATLRADGSSNFSPDNRWGYFPAAAVAWRVSEESFMAPTRNWLSDLKLRLSYGSVGNDAVGPEQWQQLWQSQANSYGYDEVGLPAYVPASDRLANTDLKWETTITRNIGLDFSLWGGKLWGNIDYYHNNTKDLLMLIDIPSVTGFTTSYKNIGKTSNKGIELALNATLFRNDDWNITAGANVAFNKNNIDRLAEGVQAYYGTQFLQQGLPSNDYQLIVGNPVGIVVGYQQDGKGFYTTDDFNYVDGAYVLKPGVADTDVPFTAVVTGKKPGGQNAYPGLPKFKDNDGSGRVDAADIREIGNTNPVHTGGFDITAQYKNFDLGLYFNWSYGQDVYNTEKLLSLYHNPKGSQMANMFDFVKDSYRYHDISSGNLVNVTEPAALDALNKSAKYPTTHLQQGYTSDLGIEDGSYLRLNTVTLGYTLPGHIAGKIGAGNLRVYGTIYNVFTLTGYSGLDPDVNTRSIRSSSGTWHNNARYPTPGMDWGTYPRARQFVLGLNVTF